MKSLGEYPFFVLSIIMSLLFIVSLFTIGVPDKTIVCINIIVFGILGIGSWIIFLTKWKNDKHLIATGKVVTGKLIKDSIKYQISRTGYRISANVSVYEKETNRVLLFKDEVLTSFEKANLVKAEQKEIFVKVIYDEKNPKRYIIYLREAIERLV